MHDDDTPMKMIKLPGRVTAELLPLAFESLEGLRLVESNGPPTQSPWHRAAVNLLVELIQYRFRDRRDFFVGGGMNIYFATQQVLDGEVCAPDVYVVTGVNRHQHRRWWATWEERGCGPELMIELVSQDTPERDRLARRRVAEQNLKTCEYFSYDPNTNNLDGWWLASTSGYERIRPDDGGRLRSEILELSLGPWQGEYQGTMATWLRCYDQEGRLVPTENEADKLRAEIERRRAEAEMLRADQAMAELERLRRQLDALLQDPPRAQQEFRG